ATVAGVYFLFDQLDGFWFATPIAILAQVAVVYLLGLAWACSLHQQRVVTGKAPLLPKPAEAAALGTLALVGVIGLGIVHFWAKQSLLNIEWWPAGVFVVGLAVAAVYALAVRLRGPQLQPSLSCESVVLLGAALSTLALAPFMASGKRALGATERAEVKGG